MEYQVAGSAGRYDGTWNLSSSVQSEVQMIALTAASPTQRQLPFQAQLQRWPLRLPQRALH